MELFSRRKSLAALAGVTAALAVAVPAASASAATTAGPTVDPQVCQILNFAQGPFGPSLFFGGASLQATLAQAGSTVNCPAPPPQRSLLPMIPGLG
jgi:ABC-type sugar transport system substrate-binding protein